MRSRRGKQSLSLPYLEHRTIVRVRFDEVDSLRIVWHGHYLKYFEDARVALGRAYGIDYSDIREAGLLAPVVHTECDYLLSAEYGDELEVVARLVKLDTPKIEFHYEVRHAGKDALLATGTSVQVFTDHDRELLLTMPDFLRDFYARTEEDWITPDD